MVASICEVEAAPYSPALLSLSRRPRCRLRSCIAAGDQRDILLHVTFLHNIREESFYAYNPSFWTLAVQAQAYVLMPVVVVLVLRASSWAGRAGWLIALIAASYGLHWATLTLAPSRGAIAELGRVAADGRNPQPARARTTLSPGPSRRTDLRAPHREA